jgi:methyl-accepting chemotaxis protein
MQKQWLGRRSLLTKFTLAMGVVALPLLLLYPLFVLPALRAQHREARVRALKPVVDTAFGLLETYAAKERAGELTREQAQARARELLEGLRHDGTEYFWVNDEAARLVMHPFLPAMVGKDLSGYRDPRGKAVFTDVVALAKARGEGAIEYTATRAGSTDYIPKVSYVKRFAPWGWVLGTGVYLEDIEREVSAAQRRLLLGLAVAMLLAVGVGLGFSRHVVRPVRVLADAANQVARGDLRVKVPVTSEDEVGRLGQAFNTMVLAIQEMVGGMGEVARATAADAERIGRSTEAMTRTAREQSAQLRRMAESVGEMSRAVSSGAQEARETARAAQASGRTAEEGSAAVEHTARKMTEMVEVVERSTQMVARLQASSQVVTQMLRLIQDVADETQMVAINTAIESARAGEHGKGFGVVAGEVRKLAHRSREVAQQIATLLQQNQEDTSAAATMMRQGTAKVREGLVLSSSTGEALGRILASVEQLAERVGRLAEDNARRSSAGESLAERMQRLSEGSAEAEAGVGQIAQAVEDLESRARQLQELSARFQAAPR